MQNRKTNTQYLHQVSSEQGNAALIGLLLVLMITGIYFLYGLWGWIVIVAVLAVASLAGMITLEYFVPRQQAAVNDHGREQAGANSKSKQPTTPDAASANDEQAAAGQPALEASNKVNGQTQGKKAKAPATPPEQAVSECYQLELMSPGKEPVQVMRLLHNELDFTADQAKKVILNRKFPLPLAQGDKETMLDKAKKLHKAGARLRVTSCQSNKPDVENAATVPFSQKAV
jgi:hypothetical protein